VEVQIDVLDARVTALEAQLAVVRANLFPEVAAGGSPTCILSGGTVTCAGDDTYSQSTPPADTFTQVAAGESYLRREEQWHGGVLGKPAAATAIARAFLYVVTVVSTK